MRAVREVNSSQGSNSGSYPAHARQDLGHRTSRDCEQAPQRHLAMLRRCAEFFPVTSKCQAFLPESDLSTNRLVFPVLGRNCRDILGSSHALGISFLLITCQAPTYHSFRVLRMKLKPSPLRWLKCCCKLLEELQQRKHLGGGLWRLSGSVG